MPAAEGQPCGASSNDTETFALPLLTSDGQLWSFPASFSRPSPVTATSASTLALNPSLSPPASSSVMVALPPVPSASEPKVVVVVLLSSAACASPAAPAERRQPSRPSASSADVPRFAKPPVERLAGTRDELRRGLKVVGDLPELARRACRRRVGAGLGLRRRAAQPPALVAPRLQLLLGDLHDRVGPRSAAGLRRDRLLLARLPSPWRGAGERDPQQRSRSPRAPLDRPVASAQHAASMSEALRRTLDVDAADPFAATVAQWECGPLHASSLSWRWGSARPRRAPRREPPSSRSPARRSCSRPRRHGHGEGEGRGKARRACAGSKVVPLGATDRRDEGQGRPARIRSRRRRVCPAAPSS